MKITFCWILSAFLSLPTESIYLFKAYSSNLTTGK